MRHAIIILAIAAMAMPAWAQAPRPACAERFDVHGTMMAPPRIIDQQTLYREPALPPPPAQRINARRASEPRPCFMT